MKTLKLISFSIALAALVSISVTEASAENNSEKIIREGECYGSLTAALNLGNQLTDFGEIARDNAYKISQKYEKITKKWSAIADSCMEGAADTDTLFKCFEKKITDKKAFSYYKGLYAAQNNIGQHSASAAQVEANNMCSTVYH